VPVHEATEDGNHGIFIKLIDGDCVEVPKKSWCYWITSTSCNGTHSEKTAIFILSALLHEMHSSKMENNNAKNDDDDDDDNDNDNDDDDDEFIER